MTFQQRNENKNSKTKRKKILNGILIKMNYMNSKSHYLAYSYIKFLFNNKLKLKKK